MFIRDGNLNENTHASSVHCRHGYHIFVQESDNYIRTGRLGLTKKYMYCCKACGVYTGFQLPAKMEEYQRDATEKRMAFRQTHKDGE